MLVFFLTSSIADDSIHNIQPAEDVLTFTIIDTGTQRDKRKLVDSHGYGMLKEINF
jgi:hypothetical protein